MSVKFIGVQLLVSSLILSATARLYPQKSGYEAVLLRVDMVPNLKQENVRWLFYMKNNTDIGNVMAGHIHILEETKPITINTKMNVFGNDNDIMLKVNPHYGAYCQQPGSKKFFGRFAGNVTVTNNCTLTPGLWTLKEANLNTALHALTPVMMPGVYAVEVKMQEEERDILGYIVSFVVVGQKKDDHHPMNHNNIIV